MSDKKTNEPQERKDYMRASKEDMNRPPAQKEGLEEPRVKEMNKIKVGVAIFVVIVLILLVWGISSDMFGLLN